MNESLLTIRNRQRARRIDLKLLRRIALDVLAEVGFERCELSVQLVSASGITRLNESFLQHKGPTDVITFSYATPDQRNALVGDVIVCVDEGVRQGRRFRTTWQTEATRYVIHGMLHLAGFDDKTAAKRRRMKQRENELLRLVARRFELARLSPS